MNFDAEGSSSPEELPPAPDSRVERDSLGQRYVPAAAYYGIQTLRASENFRLTDTTLQQFPRFITALATVKRACADANYETGLLSKKHYVAIIQAAEEIISGRFHDQFIVDVIQGGAGTSTNMNVNEVIANRALEILGIGKGEYQQLHPNNHVNLSQSTNDVYPSSLRLALVTGTRDLLDKLNGLNDALDCKATEFTDIVKLGRTQLQDAVPMTLGQEFRAAKNTIAQETGALNGSIEACYSVNLDATAIGTGINADACYATLAVTALQARSGIDFHRATDLISATSDTGPLLSVSAALRALAVKLSKLCNDLRLLSSGPRGGFGEIILPAMQPGSSIMPGKVNPVIPEAVNQVAYRIIGNDVTATFAAEAGQLQLNAMQPVIAHCLLSSIQLLSRAVQMLTVGCVSRITADHEQCRRHLDRSLASATALNPIFGYERASSVANEALDSGRSVMEVVVDDGHLGPDEAAHVLDPCNMLGHRR